MEALAEVIVVSLEQQKYSNKSVSRETYNLNMHIGYHPFQMINNLRFFLVSYKKYPKKAKQILFLTKCSRQELHSYSDRDGDEGSYMITNGRGWCMLGLRVTGRGGNEGVLDNRRSQSEIGDQRIIQADE